MDLAADGHDRDGIPLANLRLEEKPSSPAVPPFPAGAVFHAAAGPVYAGLVFIQLVGERAAGRRSGAADLRYLEFDRDGDHAPPHPARHGRIEKAVACSTSKTFMNHLEEGNQ